MKFTLKSPFKPTGDQPEAIAALADGVEKDRGHQTLLGVTGSGKTFTVANVIEKVQKPTLVIAHNKTLAAQLYQEFKEFFPNNAVSYFVSYYDYYQPEAYIPSSDTYIEKEATINDEIDKLRLATTTNLMTRPDCIVVASVSCIYNLGSPVEYGNYFVELIEGQLIERQTLLEALSQLQYDRSDAELRRGSYRLRGDVLQIWPAYEDRALSIDTLENKITNITWIDPITGSVIVDEATYVKRYMIYPAKHYLVNPNTQVNAIKQIRVDLKKRVEELKKDNKPLEAYRLEQKVNYDLEMITEFGFVNGIENYSRYFDGRKVGQAPFSLLDHFAENARKYGDNKFLTVIDESHMTLPQIRAMYKGDKARKETLIDYGFRLPSAKDNRPLQYEEFAERTPQNIYVSATPNEFETSLSGGVVEQLVRPTGLIDPEIELRRSKGQIEDLIIGIMKRKAKSQRVLVTTLTKKMAEALTEYLNDEKKMTNLIANSSDAALQRQREAEANGENKLIRTNEQLNPVELEIGPIPQEFYTTAQPSPFSGEGLESESTRKRSEDARGEALPKVAYLHSDIETLERSDILADLRKGKYDVLVGINLLREGLDLPEVTLVAILDADKEGFLRSSTALIQTMGRAARHQDGQVILYADKFTKSMKAAITETDRRRNIQLEFNKKHKITPISIDKPIRERMLEKKDEPGTDAIHRVSGEAAALYVQLSKAQRVDLNQLNPEAMTPDERKKMIEKLNRRMKAAANEMDFELAVIIRDKISTLQI
ncbi:MAG: excinuclease ABC subunit UvrB [Patescibacteria group bacterium]